MDTPLQIIEKITTLANDAKNCRPGEVYYRRMARYAKIELLQAELTNDLLDIQEALEVLKEVDRFLDGWCPTAQCCAHQGREVHERARAVLKKHGMI